ncbi:MAG: hypothetical protein WAN59_09960 [Candidatus Baltobacteraceae bacterium]
MAGALAAGCGSTANLDAIKKFGSLAAQAQQTSDAMAAALYQDCLTAREYGEIATLVPAPGATGDSLSSIPLAGVVPPEPTPVPPTNPSSAPARPATEQPVSKKTPAPAAASTPLPSDTACLAELQTSQRWQAFNDGIFAYAEGLGAVAGVAVAPSESKYQAAGEGLVQIGALRNDAIADAAGKFIADIGNQILLHRQDRDLQDLIARSHQGDIFQKMVDAALEADIGYYGVVFDDKLVVDEYFITLINAEHLELVRLLQADGDLPARASADATPQITQAVKNALERKCSDACGRHVQLVAHLMQIRDLIAVQRGRWSAIDGQLLTDLNRAQPFYSTMTDLGRANNALINVPRPGLSGYAAAIKPYIDALGGDVVALVNAIAATPGPAGKSSAKPATGTSSSPAARPSSSPAARASSSPAAKATP